MDMSDSPVVSSTSGVEDHRDLSNKLANALEFAGFQCPGPYAQELAARLHRAYGEPRPDLAEEMAEQIGASLAISPAGEMEPAPVLGLLVGIIQRHFASQGPSIRLAVLLEGLCIGYVGVLQERMNGTQTGLPRKDETQTGGNRGAIYDRYHLSTQMGTALENGEFFVVYQPIVRLTDNCFIGAEALVRWVHPTLGTLLPDQFIDLAEGNGLIAPLTAFVLEQACHHVRNWRDVSADPKPFISVNVSAANIYDPEFLPLVTSTLASAGLPADALQLELTEHVNLGTGQTSVTSLQELSALGVGIAIDDFGTGFSSLAYLRALPINVVKLAGAFIENLGSNDFDPRADEKITRAMINLAHTLGCTVTAEQVETPRQAERLRHLGCDAAQGWRFAKALPAEFFSS